jgi:NAD(P)H-quinone oxidoreductase subunit 4L
MAIGVQHYLVLSALLFSLGLYGALARRNIVAILMAIEIMLNAVNIAFVALARYIVPAALTGQVFAVFVITVAAAEVTVGLAILMALFRRRRTVDIEQVDLMRW